MYLNRITLIGFLGGDAEKKVSNATNIAVFSLATKTSWKNDAGTWESRTEWHRCVAFGRLAELAGSLTKGAHVAIEGELRSHEYQREVVVGDLRRAIPQRVWEIRVDSVLKLDPRRQSGLNRRRRPGGAPLRGISSRDIEKSTHRGRRQWPPDEGSRNARRHRAIRQVRRFGCR